MEINRSFNVQISNGTRPVGYSLWRLLYYVLIQLTSCTYVCVLLSIDLPFFFRENIFLAMFSKKSRCTKKCVVLCDSNCDLLFASYSWRLYGHFVTCKEDANQVIVKRLSSIILRTPTLWVYTVTGDTNVLNGADASAFTTEFNYFFISMFRKEMVNAKKTCSR